MYKLFIFTITPIKNIQLVNNKKTKSVNVKKLKITISMWNSVPIDCNWSGHYWMYHLEHCNIGTWRDKSIAEVNYFNYNKTAYLEFNLLYNIKCWTLNVLWWTIRIVWRTLSGPCEYWTSKNYNRNQHLCKK